MHVFAALILLLQPDAADPLREARKLFSDGKRNEAIAVLEKAVEANPKLVEAHVLQASMFDAMDRWAEAGKAIARAVELEPKRSESWQRRGAIRFKEGRFADSLADFDRYIEMEPNQAISHWQRGITCWYAGKYAAGEKQFADYQKYHDADVENAVWRCMCQAKASNLAAAQRDMLKVGPDGRVPMKEIYGLFKGTHKPEDVMTAAEAGKAGDADRNSRRFYANLYVGIWYDLTGEPSKALEHLDRATERHRIGHYMWDVARVHRDLLKTKK
ncbi:MAG: tetratricopeptide repeat protein [Gemmataceae bacterium]